MLSAAAQVMAAVRNTDWSDFSTPSENYLWSYDSSRVAPAFEQLVEAADDESCRRAVNSLLDALAHNHSGTPSLAIVRGGELLVQLVEHLDGWALAAAIDVLTDGYLFVADVSDYRTADGAVHDLTLLQPAIASLRPRLRVVAEVGGVEVRARAAQLVQTIDELPPAT